eukprot:NODE_20756_length_783_cov_4.626524.p3 GENE.NODE_20756_length_783_cov_4.626524~~NODE_20756_length_783_cov_4.626524.p3  ORF type:complete len:102 (+),score=6.29 NODE_20756_length_783_cov_4.626524:475-780(+)
MQAIGRHLHSLGVASSTGASSGQQSWMCQYSMMGTPSLKASSPVVTSASKHRRRRHRPGSAASLQRRVTALTVILLGILHCGLIPACAPYSAKLLLPCTLR